MRQGPDEAPLPERAVLEWALPALGATDAVPATEPSILRILIVTDEMEVGGSQRQILNLAAGLVRAGHGVTVAYFCERSFFVDELEQAGVRVVALDKRRRLDLPFLRRLVALVGSQPFDVVHAFAFSAEWWTCLSLACQRGPRRARFVTSIRGTYDWYGPWQWRVKRWVSRRSDQVVANSRAGAQAVVEKLGLPPAAVTVIYNGVADPTDHARAREQVRQTLALDQKVPVVLFAGRLVEVKDVATLVRAFACGCAAPATLLICGDGPLRGGLQDLVAELGLGHRVRFLGQRPDVEALIAASDVVVLPSRHEGLSNVILEAMRGGRPVVASRTGGNVELVEPGVTGQLFEVGDVPGLARALEMLMADGALGARMGAVAAARVQEHFTNRAMVTAFAELYRSTTDGTARRASSADSEGGPGPGPIRDSRKADHVRYVG